MKKHKEAKEHNIKKNKFVLKMNMASCFNSKINKAIVVGLTHNRHQFDQLTELSTSVLFLIASLHYIWLFAAIDWLLDW